MGTWPFVFCALIIMTSCGPSKISSTDFSGQDIIQYTHHCERNNIPFEFCEQFYDYKIHPEAMSSIHDYFGEDFPTLNRSFYFTAFISDLIVIASIKEKELHENDDFELTYYMKVKKTIAYHNEHYLSDNIKINLKFNGDSELDECHPMDGEHVYFLKKHDPLNPDSGYYILQAKEGDNDKKELTNSIQYILWLDAQAKKK